ncbi:MAG: hypothetical protein M3Z24_12505 [Chloroflexota bacterium]|nr:hypothetical protein [Chloroflexota bacterium]
MREHNVPDDELDIEISDLSKNADEHFENDKNTATSSIPVHVSLRSKLTARQRFWRIALASVLVAVTLGFLLNSSPAMRTTALGWLNIHSSTPTSVVAPETDIFLVDASPPWGTLFIDGHPVHVVSNPPLSNVPVLPNQGQNGFFWQAALTLLPIHLNPGHHQLVWKAAPFEPLQCSLSLPQLATDTCQLAAAFSSAYPTAQRILIHGSLNTLSLEQQQSLKLAIQAFLDQQQSTDTVQIGEQFLHVHGNSSVDRATQPLYATQHFVLDTTEAPNSSCVIISKWPCTASLGSDHEQNCLLFCTGSDEYQSVDAPGEGWGALVVVHVAWNYSTVNRRIVAQNQPDTLPTYTLFEYPMNLNITWDGVQWHVSANPNNGLTGPMNFACLTAMNMSDTLFPSSTTTTPSSGWSTKPIAGLRNAAGCVLKIEAQSYNPGTPAPSSHGPAAYCLYRFGLVLAVNDTAHNYWPQMPRTSPYEQNLVQQWINTQQGHGELKP